MTAPARKTLSPPKPRAAFAPPALRLRPRGASRTETEVDRRPLDCLALEDEIIKRVGFRLKSYWDAADSRSAGRSRPIKRLDAEWQWFEQSAESAVRDRAVVAGWSRTALERAPRLRRVGWARQSRGRIQELISVEFLADLSAPAESQDWALDARALWRLAFEDAPPLGCRMLYVFFVT